MTYEMLEGFTELGCGKWGDENDCCPDESFIREYFAMGDDRVWSEPPLHPDEVEGLFDAASDIARRAISIFTWRLDDFDRFLSEHWVGEEGEWTTRDWQLAARRCLTKGIGDGLNLEELSILISYLLRTEIPRSSLLGAIRGLGGLVDGLAVTSGATWYLYELECGFDPTVAGAYDLSEAAGSDGVFAFRPDALSEVIRIPRMLEVVAGPVRRWLLLERLVTGSYERKLVDDDGFERFDRACERYRGEVPLHIDALIERYGHIPRLHGYELAAGRWRKAGRPDIATKWEEEHWALVGDG